MPAATPDLARLSLATGLGEARESETALARKFVDHIDRLNARMGIPHTVAELREEDIAAISRGALKEALLNYPVPRHMTRRDCEQLLSALLPVQDTVGEEGIEGMPLAA